MIIERILRFPNTRKNIYEALCLTILQENTDHEDNIFAIS